MELKYILIIAVCSLFLLLFFIYLFVVTRRRAKEAATMEKIEKMYADKNLAKMDYDCAAYDDETEKIIASQTTANDQLTIDDVLSTEVGSAMDKNVFKTVEPEGMEEIKGNYTPDEN